MEAKLKERLLALTWDELREWSDARSVERGRGYLSRVEPPVLFPDGGLVAEVHGSDDYYAKLRVDASGRLEGVCTCPVGVRCKHCVALALTAAKRLKAGDDFPEADLVSRRWKRAAEELANLDGDFDCEDDFDDEWEDEDAEAQSDTRAVSASAGSVGGRAADARKRTDIVADHLASAYESCYQTICRALEKMRPVMVRLGKGDDWKSRVAELRTEYKRRSKFTAMLDALTSGRGASSRIADW